MFNQIIHIAQDEKFINSAYFQFENVLPQKNIFYIVMNSETEKLVHVKEQKSVFKIKSSELTLLANEVKDDDLVIFHSLSPEFYSLVLKLPRSIKIVWICFGFEIYNDGIFFPENRLLDTITLSHFPSKRLSFNSAVKEWARPYVRLLRHDLSYSPLEIKKKVFKRIDYLGSSFEEEYQSIQKLMKLKKKFFSFWYYPLESIVDENHIVANNKKAILIGNSGYKTGNHLDVFNKIKSYSVNEKKIIVPLSYGNADYIDIIKQHGFKQFKDQFQPITGFMLLNDYNRILETCGVAIINARRQQAIGNIIALLWFGSKVFLSKQNSFYNFLKRIGVIVYCYETELDAKNINELLTLGQINHNKIVLKQYLSSALIQDELKKQMNSIHE